MSTWHQRKGGNVSPIPRLNGWVIWEDPSTEGPASSTVINDEGDAKAHYRTALYLRGQTTHVRLIPPQWKDILRQLETAEVDPCELDELVHEMKAAEAAGINGCLDDQIEYLATQFADAKDFVGTLNNLELGKFKVVGYD